MEKCNFEEFISAKDAIIFHEIYGAGKIVDINVDDDGREWADIEFGNKNIEKKHWLLKYAIQQKLIRFLSKDAWLQEYADNLVKENKKKESEEQASLLKKRAAKEQMLENLRLREEKEKQEAAAQLKEELYKENLATINTLWQTLCDTSESFQFLGFHHHADFETFKTIWQSGAVLSRKNAKGTGIVDVANKEIISFTDDRYKGYARFYYGPKTPTYYANEGIKQDKNGAGDSHVPIPVALIMGKEMLREKGCLISDGNVRSGFARVTDSYKAALRFDWKRILSRGSHNIEDASYTIMRNAEILVPEKASLNYLVLVAFRTEADKKHAEFYFGKSDLFHVLPVMFNETIKYKRSEKGEIYPERNYLLDYNIVKTGKNEEVYLSFKADPDLYKHETRIHLKNGSTMKPVRWNISKRKSRLIIERPDEEVEYYEYLLNGNVSAIWR